MAFLLSKMQELHPLTHPFTHPRSQVCGAYTHCTHPVRVETTRLWSRGCVSGWSSSIALLLYGMAWESWWHSGSSQLLSYIVAFSLLFSSRHRKELIIIIWLCHRTVLHVFSISCVLQPTWVSMVFFSNRSKSGKAWRMWIHPKTRKSMVNDEILWQSFLNR